MKKCCLCCLQTLSSPKNEFNSIPYASFDATGTVHIELSSSLYLLHYDEAHVEITVTDTDDMKAPQVYIA